MEQITTRALVKVILIPPKDVCLKEVIAKLTDFPHYLPYPPDKNSQMETTNHNMSTDFTEGTFNSWKIPPPSSHLEAFENDVWDTIKDLKFKRHALRNNTSKRDLKILLLIQKSQRRIIVHSNKTMNAYNLDINLYHQLLHKKNHKKYKVVPNNTLRSMN